MNSKGESSAMSGGGAALVPERRFPEFLQTGPWQSVNLGSLVSINTKKVGEKSCVPMSITSGIGLVSQLEKFGRIIAGDSYKNYLQLQKNDFAYNKSATKEYPEGFIALYTGEELAAVPNSIFTCFRIKGEAAYPKYLNYLFLGNLHGRWLRKYIEVGARAHGSLSIKNSDLLAIPVPVPAGPNAIKEQQKIADCLASADALIEAQGRKVQALRAQKTSLMQQLFPQEGENQPRLRFPEFEGAGDWQIKPLKKMAERVTAKNTLLSHTRVLTNSAEFGVVDQQNYFDREIVTKTNLRGYSIVDLGDFVYNPRVSIVAPVGPVSRNNLGIGVMSPLYTVFRFKYKNTKFFGYLFKTSIWHKYVLDTANSGARHDRMNISTADFMSMPLPVCHPDEQQRIADCLTSVDDLIAADTRKLDMLKTQKRALMQQLFPKIGEDDA